jgi:ABC-type amino acid transport substrate-binding protein
MKRLLSFFFILLIFSLTANAQLSGDSWAMAQKKKEATIVITYFETPRFVYKNSSNKLDGICIDILKEFVSYVQKTKGVKIKINLQKKTDDFNLFLNNIKSSKGGVFGLAPITITEDRKKQMTFTPPYIKNRSVLITNNAAPDLPNLIEIGTSFKGMKAYTLRNSIPETEILEIKKKYFPDLQIVYVNTANEMISKTLQDPKSFTKIDFLYYADALQNNQPVKRHSAGDTPTNPLGFIMPLGSDWYSVWNGFLDEKSGFTNTAAYQQILKKHLGINATKALLGAN